MHLLQWIGSVIKKSATSPNRLRIMNVSRQVELASSVQIADSGSKRRRGLLGRKTLSEGEGLWIVPCEAVHTFGMQFPIDLVYLDRNLRVRSVRHHVVPGRLSACFTAHSVLELASGTARKSGTMPGEILEFSPAPLHAEPSVDG